jgi:GDP-L-fucose synthase
MQVSRILVTGGTGFLGRHIRQTFKDSGKEIWFPSSQELDLCNAKCIRRVIDYQPNTIIHMSSRCGGILANKNSPADFLRDNTQMALNIYEAARQANTKLVYSLGSVCAYPKHCPVPFKEDDIWNGPAEETNFPYGQAKRTLLLLGRTYRQQYGIGGAHLIPVNMYGPHDHFDLINSHVIPALINKFHHASRNGLPTVECFGSGGASREFLFAPDAAQAIGLAVQNRLDTDLPINLGVGQDILIRDLAYLIADLTGFRGEIVFTGEVSDGQPKRLLDVSRAFEMLSWRASTNLTDGLKRTIAWYVQSLTQTPSV